MSASGPGRAGEDAAAEPEGAFYARRFYELATEVDAIRERLREMAGDQDVRTGKALTIPGGILSAADSASGLLRSLSMLTRGHFGSSAREPEPG